MYSTLFTSKVCDVIFDLGSPTSRVMVSENTTQDAEALLFMTPANGQSCIIEVCDDKTPTESSTWFTLVDYLGNSILTPGPSQASQLAPITFPSWRLNAGGAVSEEVRVPLYKTHR